MKGFQKVLFIGSTHGSRRIASTIECGMSFTPTRRALRLCFREAEEEGHNTGEVEEEEEWRSHLLDDGGELELRRDTRRKL